MFDHTFALIAVFERDGRLADANEAVLQAYGRTRAQLLGHRSAQLRPFAHDPEVLSAARALFASARRGEVARGELTLKFRGRLRDFDCMVTALPDPDGGVSQLCATAVDITARRQYQMHLSRLSRELRMLTSCSQALVRTRDETELLLKICQIVVDSGYRLAWIGLPLQDEARTVSCAASAGRGADYLQTARISWSDTERGRGPVGRAIRELTLQVCRDIESDPAFAPWRPEARRHGFMSLVALPLITDERCLGTLTIYSTELDSFDEAELALLRELADDVAFGIASVRTQAARERARREMRLFRMLLDHTGDLIYAVDAQSGRIIDANATVERRLGYARAELLQLTAADLSNTIAAQPWNRTFEYMRRTGSLVSEARYRCKSGEVIPVEATVRYVDESDRPYMVFVVREITERLRHEERMMRLTRLLRVQSAINAAVLRIQERDELLREVCDIAARTGGFSRVIFYLTDAGGRRALPAFRAGPDAAAPEPEPLTIGDGIEPDPSLSAQVLRTGVLEVSGDLARSEPPISQRDALIARGYRVMVALPLNVDGRHVGLLTLASREAEVPRDEELLILQDIMASLSLGLQSQQTARAAQFLEYFDPLTGLAKRALFCERVDVLLQHRAVVDDAPEIIVFDLHDLGSLNDSFGRHFGDLCVQKIAERLRMLQPSDERLGYLGAGAFAMLVSHVSGDGFGAATVLQNVIFGSPLQVEDRSIRLTYSSGAARFQTDGTDAHTLLQRAETALSRAKATGEQYLHFRLEIHSELAERLELEHQLRAAVDEQQFEIYYQPQLEVASGRIEALEALLRWRHPTEGVLPPARFLRVLETSGMIMTVGDWVLDRIAEDCERWSQLGYPALHVAANVSALQLRRKSFVPHLLELQRRLTRAGAFRIDVEITETVLLQDLESTEAKLRELRSAGVRVALDDFGTGYSSLGLLSKLPVDLLKIDRSFVTGLPDNRTSVLLVESILRLASAFGLRTVAEGVETREQFEAARRLGCSLSQGYLHARPLPRAEIEAMIGRETAAPHA